MSLSPLATIDKPNPLPSFLDEMKGSKIFGSKDLVIPEPKSIISICKGRLVGTS